VAKSIIQQFDIPKKKKDQHLDKAEQGSQSNNTEQELQDLAGDIDLEEQKSLEAQAQHRIDGKTGEPDMEIEPDDDVEGWVDKMASLSPAKCKRVKGGIRPVRLVLVKVSYQQCMTKL